MKKRIFKSAISLVLTLAMVVSLCVPAFAANGLNLVWPIGEWNEGTPPQWALEADWDTQNATIDAINNEYDNQIASGFDMGAHTSFGAWGNMVIAQFEGGDNIGNPWGQAGRLMGAIVAPYPGVAFTVKAYFGARLGEDKVPLSNQIVWTNPESKATHTYQMFKNGLQFHDMNGNNYTEWGYYPGSGQSDAVAEAFREKYAYTAQGNLEFGEEPINLGVTFSDAVKTPDGIIYQEFMGNDSTGATPDRDWDEAYGVSYLVMHPEYGTVSVIRDEMVTAWATTWTENEDGTYDRFAVTGAPVDDTYIDEDGTLYQNFENCTLILEDPENPRSVTMLSARAEISDFSIGENFVYMSEDNYYIDVYLTDKNADITKLTPTFTVSDKATVDKASGKAYDFSEPVDFEVTAENGDIVVYTVNVEAAGEPTVADQEMVEYFKSLFDCIHDPISYEDGGYIIGLSICHDLMTPKQKYMVQDSVPEIERLVAAYEALLEDPIKIAFIGDSITDEQLNGNNYATQVGRDLTEMGLPFVVGNFGHTNHCMSAHSDDPYQNSERYTNSLNFEPDYVFIMLGTNDSKPRNWDTRNVKATFKQDMIDLIQSYQDLPTNPQVIIATSPTVVDEYGDMDTINNTYVTEIAAIQREVAEELDLPLIDINEYTRGQLTWYNESDGIHPNGEGHNNMKLPFLEYITDRANSCASDITINGETIAEFDPYSTIYNITVEDPTDLSGIEVAATAESENATVTVTMDEENARCKVDIQGGMDRFALTYMLYFVEAPEYALGDVDMSGDVDVSDIIKLKSLIMTESSTKEELALGDLNESGTLEVGDIIGIKAIIMSA